MPPAPTPKEKGQLDRIEAALIGNGREGLLARTARIEEKLEAANDAREEIKKNLEKATLKTEGVYYDIGKSISELTKNCMKLEAIVAQHISTEHLSVMMKKKSFWVTIFVVLILINLIAIYVPNIWDFVVRMVGIPKLALPLQ